jgi:hypothetical protein
LKGKGMGKGLTEERGGMRVETIGNHGAKSETVGFDPGKMVGD